MDLKELFEKATPRPWRVINARLDVEGGDKHHVGRLSRKGKKNTWVSWPEDSANAAFIVHAVNRIEEMLKAFQEIIKCEAPFKRDQLDFANSVITRHVEIAEEAIRQAEEVAP